MRNQLAFFLTLGVLCLPVSSPASGLFVSFYNTDTVGLYDAQTGALINPAFISTQSPIGLAIGPGNNLYVGTDNQPSGAGAAIFSYPINGTTAGTPVTFADHISHQDLNNPQGIALRNGNLYAADATAGSVFVYNSAGVYTSTLSAPAFSLSAPIGLTFDTLGTLYLADLNEGNILSYSGGNFAQVNANFGAFPGGRDVAAGNNGNVYVLDTSGGASGGIYELRLSDGSAHRIVDYSSIPFQASNIVMGPDGQLYVSGQDLETAEGEILRYGIDGVGGDVFAHTGFLSYPGFMAFEVPEPSTLALGGLALAAFVARRRCHPARR